MLNNEEELNVILFLFPRMSEKFQSCLDPQLYDEGLKSIRSITELLKRLLDYRYIFPLGHLTTTRLIVNHSHYFIEHMLLG